MITATIVGWRQVIERFGKIPQSAHDELLATIEDLAALVRGVMQAKAPRRSGRLAGSIRARVSDQRHSILARVSARRKYAAIQEFGGTVKATLIQAKHGKALAFASSGGSGHRSGLAFYRAVHHPAFRVPAHSYARTALAETKPVILARIEAAIGTALTSARVR